MNIIEELEKRGYIEQLTHEKELKEEFDKGSVSFYIGIDPTANSMHIGHFVALMVEKLGTKHRKIVLDTPELYDSLEQAMMARDMTFRRTILWK